MFKKNKIKNINDSYTKNYKKSKLSIITFLLGIISSFIIVFIGIAIIGIIGNKGINIGNIMTNNQNINNKDESIKEKTGKINILIIGRGGDENDAPDLTDTIILASINYDKKTVSMLSIPRDLYIKYTFGGEGKINEAYGRLFRKEKNENDSMLGLSDIITKITGEKIDYYINIDFEGFRKIIDNIGGITVDVPDNIVDTTYPGPNHTFVTFKINKGLQKMSGEIALKYARSRHSTSDFDRSLRQQLIIKAIKEKIMSLGFLTNPLKIKGLYDIISENIKTNIETKELISLAIFSKEIDKENIFSSNLNNTCIGYSLCEKGGFLYTPPRENFGGASVLVQEGALSGNMSDFDIIKKYSNFIFNFPLINKENLEINVFNSTKVGGLAEKYSSELTRFGFNIPKKKYTGNTNGEIYEKSKIFYYSTGITIPETVKALETFIFGGTQKLEVEHKYSKNESNKIEIIIGNDYKTIDI